MRKIVVVITILFTGYIGWYFWNGFSESTILYKQAVKMNEAGDVRGAHDALAKALELNPLNRKVIKLKSELYVYLKAEDDFVKAQKLYEKGTIALESGDADKAQKAFRESYDLLSLLPRKSKEWPDAEILMGKIEKSVDEFSKVIPEKITGLARQFMAQGQYMRAFETLSRGDQKDGSIIRMRSEVAFIIGAQRLAGIKERGTGVHEVEIRDGIYWFEQVDTQSPDYDKAQSGILELQEMLPNATKIP